MAARYGEAADIPRTKMAWALAPLIGKTDSAVYYKLKEASDLFATLTPEQLSLLDLDFSKVLTPTITITAPVIDTAALKAVEQEVEEEEELGELPVTDDTLEQHVGEIIRIKIIGVRTFGALCSVVGTTRTLLLHVSEMADEYVDDVSAYVSVDDEVYAMLILSRDQNRLAVS